MNSRATFGPPARLTLVCAALLSLTNPGCSGFSAGQEDTPGDNPDAQGSGGASPNTGGAPSGDGGASSGGFATGGAPFGTGGVGTGGALGSGGALGTGGALSTGGQSATGGEAATGGDSSSGGTGGGFQPCPVDEPCKILPLGDSITFGLGFDGGYRVELFRLAEEAGHDITFTGSQPPNGPATVAGVSFPRSHEGISGETIEQIAARIPSPGLNEPPHIVLVHAGTNDMWSGAEGAPNRLGSLIDELTSQAPDALVVVSNIIPFPSSAASVDAYNAGLLSEVEERIESGAHVLFVDQFEDFPTNELGDGVHPNESGYARMANKWYQAIEGYLQ